MARSQRWLQPKQLLRKSITRAAGMAGITALAMRRQTAKCSPYLRAVNYHWTPPEHARQLDEHFRFFAQEFECLSEATLEDFFLQPASSTNRPFLIISFDDGFRNNFDVAAEILERHSLNGWFFVIASGCRSSETILEGNLNTNYCMKWAEIRELQSRGHTIGCHTLSHCNVGLINPERLHAEIVEARDEMQTELGTPIHSFCFPYGTSNSYSQEALELVTQYYRFAFTSFPNPVRPTDSRYGIGRIPVESGWTLDDIRFRLAGLMDYRYERDRRRFSHCVTSVLQRAGQ